MADMYDYQKAIDFAYRPYDIVKHKNGDVGIITEVSIGGQNTVSGDPYVSYSVNWLFGSNLHTAWFGHSQLTVGGNIFDTIAEKSVHPFGGNEEYAAKLVQKIPNE